MVSKRKKIGGLVAAGALVMALASPATAAPANGIVVDVQQHDLGLEIAFTCAAVATGAATSTEISSCRMEFRREWYGWVSEAPAVQSDGPVAATWGHETGLQGGEDHWRVDTWICWEASATFVGGSTADSSGCKQVA